MSYGVKVTGIQQDNSVKRTYDPTSPQADQNGYVETSNVNLADQMVDMIQAMRTYEANETAAESNKEMLKEALEISKRIGWLIMITSSIGAVNLQNYQKSLEKLTGFDQSNKTNKNAAAFKII